MASAVLAPPRADEQMADDQEEIFDSLEPGEQAALIVRWTAKLTLLVVAVDFMQGDGVQLRTLAGGLIGLAVAAAFYLRGRWASSSSGGFFRKTGADLLTAPGFAAIGVAVGALWAHVPATLLLRRADVEETLPQDWLFIHGIMTLGFAGFATFLAALTIVSPKTTGSSKLAAVIAVLIATVPVVEWVARYRAHSAATAVDHEGTDGVIRTYQDARGLPAAKWFGRDGRFVEVVVEPYKTRLTVDACRQALKFRMERVGRRLDDAPFTADTELPPTEWCRFSAAARDRKTLATAVAGVAQCVAGGETYSYTSLGAPDAALRARELVCGPTPAPAPATPAPAPAHDAGAEQR